jgi:hypothetical protein
MYDERCSIVVQNEDHLNQAASATASANQPFAILAAARVRTLSVYDGILGLFGTDPMLSNVVDVPGNPPKVHNAGLDLIMEEITTRTSRL